MMDRAGWIGYYIIVVLATVSTSVAANLGESWMAGMVAGAMTVLGCSHVAFSIKRHLSVVNGRVGQ